MMNSGFWTEKDKWERAESRNELCRGCRATHVALCVFLREAIKYINSNFFLHWIISWCHLFFPRHLWSSVMSSNSNMSKSNCQSTLYCRCFGSRSATSASVTSLVMTVHIPFVLKLFLVLMVWDALRNYYRCNWKDIFHHILKCTNLYMKLLKLVNKQKPEPGNDSEYHFLIPSLSTGQYH